MLDLPSAIGSFVSHMPGGGGSTAISVAGTVVVITGGAGGIGRATAAELVRRGAVVIIGDIDGAAAARTAAEVGARAGRRLDVSDRLAFTAFLDEVEAQYGPLDALVNNAGIMPLGPLVEETDATTDRVLKVNLHAVIHGTREAARRMLPRGRGHIVNLASTLGKAGLPGGATYCATKFAVVGFCEAMDAELAGSGVRISVVLPGVVDTSLGEGVRSPRIIRRVQPHDVALAIADVLASPRYEVYVPFEAGPLSLAAAALPHRMRDRLSRAMGLHATLAHADAGARAAYEARLRETVADHEAPAKLVG